MPKRDENQNKFQSTPRSRNSGISVLVTAYNREQFLGQALDSLIRQTYCHFEVILITNFHFDLSNYSALNVRHFIQEGTIGSFLYTGVVNSNYDIICFLDDDDLFNANKLEVIARYFDDSLTVFVHNNYDLIDENGVVRGSSRSHVTSNLSAQSILRSAIDLDTLKNIYASPDLAMYLFALTYGGKVHDLSTKLSLYRRHSQNISSFSRDNIQFMEITLCQFMAFEALFKNRPCMRIIKFNKQDFRLAISSVTKVKTPFVFIRTLCNLALNFKLTLLRVFLRYFIEDYIRISDH